ncbi:hypothetical protein OJF2_47090 [Aquisphaera giovannonii]|uniref:Uncharacterized protein n=1 Tax=Aquisphaera giovannonii TaxID=406548 RepID=A0A5B9W7P2_9BACT|nr:hypothetical protein [Aquisphaera giovannonii]QEH36149.1 hypothetical protein OJF2_47090 [Aquisphaera giovannonii]
MTIETFEDHGLRFEYPAGWELDVTDHGQVLTVAVQEPGGLGFALITTDGTRPDPNDVAEAALEAMREEYPDLDASPVLETINDHCTTGHDVEFFAMDMTNAATIRCFRTPRHTVLAFGQWSDAGEDRLPDQVRDVLRSIEDLDE